MGRLLWMTMVVLLIDAKKTGGFAIREETLERENNVLNNNRKTDTKAV